MENKKTKLCILMLVMLLGVSEVSCNMALAQGESEPVVTSEVNQDEVKANKETLEKAEESIANKDYQSAIVYLTAYINSKPKKYEAYKLRGDAFYALHQFRLAEADYKKAITLKTDDDKFVTGTKVLSAVVLGADKQSQYQNPELGNLYGRLMYAQKALNNPAYESTYEQAFKYNSHIYLPKPKKEDVAKINCPQKYGKVLNPQGVDEYIMDAVSMIEGSNYHEAVYKIQYITSNYPKYYLGHYLMGVAMSGMEQYDDAIHSFELALKYNPYDFESFASLGQLFYRKAEKTFSADDARKSIDYFNKAIKYNPTCHIYHYYIGLNHMIIGDYNLAVSSFDNAIRLKANDYNSIYYKLVAEYIMEDYSTVVDGTTNLLYRHVSNYNSVLYLRALAYYHLGNSDAALSDLDKIHVNMDDIYNDDLRPLSPKEQTLGSYLYYLKAKILQGYGLGVKADLEKAYENPIIAELDKSNGKFSENFVLTPKQVDTEYDYIRTTFSSYDIGLEYLDSSYRFVSLKPVSDNVVVDDELKMSTSPEDTLSVGKSSIAQILASQSFGVVQAPITPVSYDDVVSQVPTSEIVKESTVVETPVVEVAQKTTEQTEPQVEEVNTVVEQVEQDSSQVIEKVAQAPDEVRQEIQDEVNEDIIEQEEQVDEKVEEVTESVNDVATQKVIDDVNPVAEEVSQVINDLKAVAEEIVKTPPAVVEKHAQVDLSEFNTVQSRKVLVLKDDDEIIEFEPVSLKDKVEHSAPHVITPITSADGNKIAEEIIKNQQLSEDVAQQEVAKVAEITDGAKSVPVDVNITQSEVTTKVLEVPAVEISADDVVKNENNLNDEQSKIVQAEVPDVDIPEVEEESNNKTLDEIIAPEISSVTNNSKKKKSWFAWFKRDKNENLSEKAELIEVQEEPKLTDQVLPEKEEFLDNNSSDDVAVETKRVDEDLVDAEQPLIRTKKAEIEEVEEVEVSQEKKKFVWWWNRNNSKTDDKSILPEDKVRTKKIDWKKFFTPNPKTKIEEISDDKTVEEMTQEIIENIENGKY